MNEDQIPGNLELHGQPERRFLRKSRCLGKDKELDYMDVGEDVWQKDPKSTRALKGSMASHLLCTFGLNAYPVS